MTTSAVAPLGLILLGLVLGMRHATDPDHVIAVTTIVSRERKVVSAAWIGAVWGAGHTLTVFVVGGAIILMKLAVPEALAAAMEFAVALMLIALGVSNLRSAGRGEAPLVHAHTHRHGDVVHSHPHAHFVPDTDTHEHLATSGARTGPVPRSSWTAFGVGVVHGLAGSAAIALLVLAAIPDARWALAYLLFFGAGTVAGMVAITTAIGLPVALAATGSSALNRALTVGAGCLSLAFGLFLAVQIGLSGALFRF